jgi:hypothetical protein
MGRILCFTLLWLVIFTDVSCKSIEKLPFETAKGHFFTLSIKDTADVIRFLETKPSFSTLISHYPNIVIDRNLLVCRKAERDYKGNDLTCLVGLPLSFGSAEFRKISIPNHIYNKKFNVAEGKFSYIYYVEVTKNELFNITGYYLEEDFEEVKLPPYAARWEETFTNLFNGYPIFLVDISGNNEYKYDFSDPISTFLNYFDEKTLPYRPVYTYRDTMYSKKNELFRLKSISIRDSLIKYDNTFKRLLNAGNVYGLKNKISKNGFYKFVKLVSKEDALTHMRCEYPFQRNGGNSFFLNHVIDIYHEAKMLQKDSLAIVCASRIFFGSMNFHHEVKVSEAQRDAIKYLLSKGFSLGSAILGEILHYKTLNERSNLNYEYYMFNNDTINRQILEQLTLLSKMDLMDPLRKIALLENLHSLIKQDTSTVFNILINEQLMEIQKSLPDYITNRLTHQATSFEELFYKEKDVIMENFIIQHVDFGYISGKEYSWIADVLPKWSHIPLKVRMIHDFYDMKPCWDDYVGKIKKIESIILGNKLLSKELDMDKVKSVSIFFNYKSANFTPNLTGCGYTMPNKIFQKYKNKWATSINIDIELKDDPRVIDLILFNDSSFLIEEIHENVKIGPFKFDDLFTYSEKSDYGFETFYSYKLVDSTGVIVE